MPTKQKRLCTDYNIKNYEREFCEDLIPVDENKICLYY